MNTTPPTDVTVIEFNDDDDRSDHDLLICIEQKVKNVILNQGKSDKRLDDHLKGHRQMTAAAVIATFTGIVTLVVGIVLLIVKAGIN